MTTHTPTLALSARLLTLLLAASATAQYIPVTATAQVSQMRCYTQVGGSPPSIVELPAGTPISPSALLENRPGQNHFCTTRAFLTAAEQIELVLSHRAFANPPQVGHATASYDSVTSILCTAGSPTVCSLQLEVTYALPAAPVNVGVDVDGDGVIDLQSSLIVNPVGIGLLIDGTRKIDVYSSGRAENFAYADISVRIVPSQANMPVQQVLPPCSDLRMRIVSSAGGSLAVEPSGGYGLTLMVFGFQPAFTMLPQAPGCFWLPQRRHSSSPYVAGSPALLLSPALLNNVELFGQLAQFRALGSNISLVVSDSYLF